MKKRNMAQDVNQLNQDAEIQDQNANVTPMEDMTIDDIISDLSAIPEIQNSQDGVAHTIEMVVEKKKDGFNLVSLQYQGEEKKIDESEYLKMNLDQRMAVDKKQVMSRKPMGK